METVKKLKAWLELPGNSAAKMAHLLGYRSSNTVAQWVSRGRVPGTQEKHVLKIIERKT